MTVVEGGGDRPLSKGKKEGLGISLSAGGGEKRGAAQVGGEGEVT